MNQIGLDRGIQYAALVVVTASSLMPFSGILGRPVKPGDDKMRERSKQLNAPPRPSAWSRLASAPALRSPAARCPSRWRAP
ncbi:hypothetical protein CV770_37395 [Bradyrhizobium sp. AC87j1]|nr:hypothetical protein CV770_37395 [Bradyrhizobium sp. AC87j1]